MVELLTRVRSSAKQCEVEVLQSCCESIAVTASQALLFASSWPLPRENTSANALKTSISGQERIMGPSLELERSSGHVVGTVISEILTQVT